MCETQGPGPSAVWSGAELQTLPSPDTGNTQLRASKTAQLRKELAARPGDLSSSHGTLVEEREMQLLQALLLLSCVHMSARTHTYMCTYMHTHDF